MNDTAIPSVLRRKLKPLRRPKGAAPGIVEDCISLVFPRAADEVLALPVEIRAVSSREMAHSEALDALSEQDLIFLLEGHGGAAGLCVLDTGLVASLIEVQLTGRVSPAEPVKRLTTRTDAVVVSEMVDRWVSGLKDAAAEGGFADVMPLKDAVRTNTTLDKRAAMLTLDPGRFEMLRIAMSLDGAKEGVLTFFLPPRGGNALSNAGADSEAMRARMMELPAVMEAILARVRRPLSEVLAFAPGDCVILPDGALQNMRLEAVRGRRVVPARLGQLQGKRAVLLSLGNSEDDNLDDDEAAPALAEVSAPQMLSQIDTEAGVEPIASVELTDLPEIPDLPELPDDLPQMENADES